jgi:ATP-dependent Clp protease ATP-binding subunit ClpB
MFRPRLDKRVGFASQFEQIAKIVDVQIDHLRGRLADRHLKLDLTPAAVKLLAEEGYDPTYGARPLKRVIQQRIENPIASKILGGEFGENETITIDVDSAKQAFTFSAKTPKREKQTA